MAEKAPTGQVATILRATEAMREQHGPEHKRHAMWDAMATLLYQIARDQKLIDDGVVWSTSIFHTAAIVHAERTARAYLAAPTHDRAVERDEENAR